MEHNRILTQITIVTKVFIVSPVNIRPVIRYQQKIWAVLYPRGAGGVGLPTSVKNFGKRKPTVKMDLI